jgi:hypothetical protein
MQSNRIRHARDEGNGGNQRDTRAGPSGLDDITTSLSGHGELDTGNRWACSPAAFSMSRMAGRAFAIVPGMCVRFLFCLDKYKMPAYDASNKAKNNVAQK